MDTKNIVIILVLAVVLVIATTLIKNFLMRKYTLKLMNAMAEDEETFNSLVDSFMVKSLFEPYNREYLRLNYYIAHDTAVKVKNQVDLLDKMRMNKEQKQAYMNLAFQYYVMGRKEKEAKKMGKRLIEYIQSQELEDGELMIEDINFNLAVFIDNDMEQLPKITEKIESTEKDEKATWLFRRAYLYKHNGKKEEAENDLREALNHVSNEGQKEVINKILEEGIDLL